MTSFLLLITIALSGLNLGVVRQTPHFSSCDALIVALALGGALCVSLYHLLMRLKPCAGVAAGVDLASAAASATVAATLHDPASKRVRTHVAASIPPQRDDVADDDKTASYTAVRSRRRR